MDVHNVNIIAVALGALAVIILSAASILFCTVFSRAPSRQQLMVSRPRLKQPMLWLRPVSPLSQMGDLPPPPNRPRATSSVYSRDDNGVRNTVFFAV
ncbi:hypothetical protein HYQ45_004077 [Verticillium longisporum]|uniref:Uncharacterized protein n=1 Tax=Verticillium longisporum TaxID=100787 RepID=A0A8I2ZVY6_VERLO|nr:hypothetical protein HYQ45_004077 [Verticillium longisporum]